MKHPVEDEVVLSYALPGSSNPDVLKDTAAVMSSASTAAIHAAARRLIDGPPLPTLLVWSREDTVFPLDHAVRYADLLPDADLATIDDSFSFTPEDQPEALANAIRQFLMAQSQS